MALTAGSVTVASNETRTGSGLALEIYDEDVATLSLPALPTLGQNTTPFTSARPCLQSDIDVIKAARLALLQDAARRATAYAAGIVAYFKANGKARISTSTSCGRTPNPNDPNVAIQPPAANVDLSII